MDFTTLGILGAVFAAVSTAVVALTKRKPEASEIVVRMSLNLSERQQAMLEDRDERLAKLEADYAELIRKHGVLHDVVEELKDSLSRVEHERDKAVERARLAEEQAAAAESRATAAEGRATAAEAQVAQLRERLTVLENKVANGST